MRRPQVDDDEIRQLDRRSLDRQRRRQLPMYTWRSQDDLQQVVKMLDKMDLRDAAVLRLRFGLTGEEPLTLKDIGECLDLTRERVRQIEGEALRKLYEMMES